MSSLSNFQKLKELGKGSFSTVYKVCRKSDSKEYAMKVVKITQLSEKERQNALNEIRILASIVDPYIIAYKEAFFDEGIRCLCIIMEYADAGDLMQKINAKRLQKTLFSESQIWKFLVQMTKGLRSLHSLKILHRDLKCANIFLTGDGTLKLGDLNVSKITQKGLAITQAGTPYYCAPEVWKGNVYDKKCDIWSLGCVLYELASLKPPFQGTGMKDLFNRISKGEFERIPKTYSNELFDIIRRCLKLNPNERPSCDEILNHSYIRENFPEESSGGKAWSKAQLLNTIKMPRNLQGLKEKLPKPNYQLNNRSFDEDDQEEFSSGIGGNNIRKRCPSESGLKEKALEIKENYQNDRLDFKGNLKPLSSKAKRYDEELPLKSPLNNNYNINPRFEKPPIQKSNKVEQPHVVAQPMKSPISINRPVSGREIQRKELKEGGRELLKVEKPAPIRKDVKEKYVERAKPKPERPLSRQEIKNKLVVHEEKKHVGLAQGGNRVHRPSTGKDEKDRISARNEGIIKKVPPRTPVVSSQNKENVVGGGYPRRYPGLEVKHKKK